MPFGVPFWLQIRPWNAPRANSRPISPSWRVPGRVPEGPWEAILGTFFAVGLAGTKKKAPKVPINTEFSSICCMRFLTASVCILCASALAGAKAQLQKLLQNIGFCGGICVCAICARSTTNLQTERKSNKIRVKSHTTSTLSRKLQATSKKCRFESQNASQNRPRRPGRAPGPPPARDFRQKSFHFWLLPALRWLLGGIDW